MSRENASVVIVSSSTSCANAEWSFSTWVLGA